MSGPPRPSAPFHHLAPALAVAAAYLLATVGWVVFAASLPGGRWFAVHLFTVGVVTNLVVALSHHFATTLLHTEAAHAGFGRFGLLNAGALALIGGRLAGWTWLFAAGGTMLIAAVAWLYVNLRRQRKASLTSRFSFIVRVYERACSAFFHGALLGILMGVGVLGGTWYGAARLAHVHVNVLGWGGLTLLATVVFFGPTMMRTRLQPGADASAHTALRVAATGLSIGAIALLATGWAGGPQTLFRWVAAAGLGAYAAAALAVCVPVLRAGRRAVSAAHVWLIGAACTWFVIATWADVIAVASGWLWLLDAVGIALLAGVIGQAILAALNFLGPMVLAAGTEARNAARKTLDRLPGTRAVALNLGVACLVAAVPVTRASDRVSAVLLGIGWAGVGSAVVAQLGLMAAVRLRADQAGRNSDQRGLESRRGRDLRP